MKNSEEGFSVGDWIVDPPSGRLEHRHDHTVVRLRPKSMAVLVLLAQAKGVLVSRRHLLESVWPETLASDESLTRCIADLRQVLDQDDGFDGYMETIPKRGYRLLAPVTLCVSSPGGVGAWVLQKRLSWIGLAGSVGLIGLALVSWNIYQDQTRSPVVAVIPTVHKVAGTSGSDLQVTAINDLLFQRLSEVPELKVRGPGAFSGDTPPLIKAAEFGADYAVELTPVIGIGTDKQQLLVRLHYLLQKPYPSSIVDRLDLPLLDSEQSFNDFLALRENIAHSILDRLMPALKLPESSAAQPGNLLAYRLYLQARNLLIQPGCDGSGPNELLRQSIELDPGYVPARVALGWAEYGLAATCGLGPGHYELALKMADQTLEIAPAWIPALNLKAMVLTETGRSNQALALLQSAAQQLPRSAFIQFGLSYANCYAGDLAAAEVHLRNTLEIDPMFLTAEGWTPNVLLYQQNYEAFLQHLPATPSTLFDFYRGFALLRLQRDREAVEALRRGYQINPNDIFGQLSGALLAVQGDDARAAVNILQALAKRRTDQGARDGEVTFKVAQIAALAGAMDFSLAQLRLAWKQGFQCLACMRDDPLLSELATQFEGVVTTHP